MHSDRLLSALQNEWEYPRVAGLEVRDSLLVRIHPRDDDEFVLEYELGLYGPDGAVSQPVTVELLDPAVVESRWRAVVLSLQKSRRKQLKAADAETYVACFPALGLILRFPALDERLGGLKLLHKPKIAARVLAPYLGTDEPDPGRLEVEVLGHRLGRRCTARFSATGHDPPASVIAKFYKSRGGRGHDVDDLMSSLRAAGLSEKARTLIPEPLAYLEEWQTLLMADVHARPINELPPDAVETGVTMAARAIADFHAVPLHLAGTYTVEDELNLLTRWTRLVGQLHEPMRGPTLEAFARVSDALMAAPCAEPTLVHRDYYDKQVLIAGERCVLLDFDTACTADPAIDVGNFLAHLRLRNLQRPNVGTESESAFLEAYSYEAASYIVGDRNAFATRVHAYRRAALLRLACLYSFWPKWSHVSAPLLEAL